MGLFLKRPDAEEIKVNWLQDIGPIYPNDDYMPHVLLHNPKTKKDGEYISLFCDNKQEAIAIIDHIIELNGGKDKFFKHEIEGWSHVFSGHLFAIRYRNELIENYVIVELNRREERKVVRLGNDKSEILYGIHKDSKKINSIIKGLNSIVYNSGEKTSGGGHLYFDSSGSHIVSYWDDIENAIKQFKSIVDSYPENAINKDWMGSDTEIKDFSNKNLLEIINNEDFLIEFKTDGFKINLSQGNSSFQMNIYIDEDELIINETERLEKERASLMSNEEIIEEVAENEIEIQEKERLKKIAEIKKEHDELTYYVEGRKYSLLTIEKSNALKKQRVSLLTDKEIIEEIVKIRTTKNTIANKRRVASSRRRSARRVDWAGEPILTFLEIEFINRGLIRDLTPVEAELVSEFISKIEEIQLKFEEKERERQDELVHRENIKFKQAARAQAALQRKLNKKWWEFWK